ncbi:GntR family transcriptional regulator [Roseibium sp. CAU 1637]|uniref:GntR family transcriptional regulator n=1 Tax=Roseibium limicola TaxID=2816037 RepID=A0A939JAV0_9HYPH|nr:GntR family transcriptional regulator [Roseibium limicola]
MSRSLTDPAQMTLPTSERGRGENSRGSKVYRQLLDRMRSGDLKPGARMREDETAVELEVSRTPVREAFNRLHARGLVESTRGGWTVADLSRNQIMELYALRSVLEGAAARFAAENASPVDQASLKMATEAFETADNDEKTRARSNIRFHEMIYAAAHNTYLIKMLEDLNDSLALLPSTTFSVPGRAERAVEEHRNIALAIADRNAQAAEDAARFHISQAMEARLKMLFES